MKLNIYKNISLYDEEEFKLLKKYISYFNNKFEMNIDILNANELEHIRSLKEIEEFYGFYLQVLNVNCDNNIMTNNFFRINNLNKVFKIISRNYSHKINANIFKQLNE